MAEISCANCGITIALSDGMEARRREDHKTFYCPNGHHNYFSGESDAEKYKRLLSEEKDAHAKTREEWRGLLSEASGIATFAIRRAAAYKGHYNRLKKEVQ